jgi:hypothetical protein
MSRWGRESMSAARPITLLRRAGEELTVRARVTGNHERKGHRFVRLDGPVVANGKTPTRAAHTAIYRPCALAA